MREEARERGRHRDHRGGRGGDSPPTTWGGGHPEGGLGASSQPCQDNDCYCAPAADPVQTVPSCSSCRAPGPL